MKKFSIFVDLRFYLSYSKHFIEYFRIFLRGFQAIKNHRSIKLSDWLLFFFCYYLFVVVLLMFFVVLFPKSAKKSTSEKLLFFLTYFFVVYLLSSKSKSPKKLKLTKKILCICVLSFFGIWIDINFYFLSFLQRKINLFTELFL